MCDVYGATFSSGDVRVLAVIVVTLCSSPSVSGIDILGRSTAEHSPHGHKSNAA